MIIYLFVRILSVHSSTVGVIDVGSTGTRLNIFEYKDSRIVKIYNFENTPGLSELDDKQIEDKLLALVERVGKNIPIGIYCTAGFRGIPPELANHKLKVMEYALRDYNIKECRILSGEEEGYLAYLTLIYFKRGSRRYKDRDNALVDMGGRSVQVVYPTNNKLKTVSYQLGHKEGVSALDCHLLEDICIKKLSDKLSSLEPLRDLSDMDVYLSSFFYDVLIKNLEKKSFNLSELMKIFSKKCNGLKSPDCKDFFYVVTFLLELGIPKDKILYLLGYLNGVRFNWSIGKALEMLNHFN